jgi:LEA14-like dessication related protein
VSSDQRRFPFLVSRLPVLVGLVLLGCATLRSALQFQAPEFTLHELRVTSIGLTGGTMDLVFDVYNPNSYRLRSTRLQVGIDLESTHFGDAELTQPLDLTEQSHGMVIVPIRFEWAGIGAGAKALLTRREIHYGFNGAALLDTPLGDQRVGLHGTGTVPLSKLVP